MHTFCMLCISKHLRVASEKTCPACRMELSEGTLGHNLIAEDFIQQLVVRCSNHHTDGGAAPVAKRPRTSVPLSPGCRWEGKLSLRDQHVAADCGLTEVACGLEGCGASVFRRDLKEHEEACTYRLVPCEHCGSSFAHCGLKAHVRTTCPLVKVQCPFEIHGCKCKPAARFRPAPE